MYKFLAAEIIQMISPRRISYLKPIVSSHQVDNWASNSQEGEKASAVRNKKEISFNWTGVCGSYNLQFS